MNIILIYKNVTFTIHDDAITWKCILYLWPFVWGILKSPVDSPHKGLVMQGFYVFIVVGLQAAE